VEQRKADIRLELFQQPADRRLGAAQCRCRLGYASAQDSLTERVERARGWWPGHAVGPPSRWLFAGPSSSARATKCKRGVRCSDHLAQDYRSHRHIPVSVALEANVICDLGPLVHLLAHGCGELLLAGSTELRADFQIPGAGLGLRHDGMRGRIEFPHDL